MPEGGQLIRADALPRQETRQQEVEEGRLGEHPAPRHPEERHLPHASHPEEAPGMRRHAVPDQLAADPLERREHGVERTRATIARFA